MAVFVVHSEFSSERAREQQESYSMYKFQPAVNEDFGILSTFQNLSTEECWMVFAGMLDGVVMTSEERWGDWYTVQHSIPGYMGTQNATPAFLNERQRKVGNLSNSHQKQARSGSQKALH